MYFTQLGIWSDNCNSNYYLFSALEYSSNAKAEIVGKPNKQFFLSSIEDFKLKPEECIMIGDVILFSLYFFILIMIMVVKDAIDDVEGAMNAGMMAILVRTGKYRQNDESKIKNPIYVAENFENAVEFILKNFI